MSRPRNPYSAGPPVHNESAFFGRRDTLSWVNENLYDSQNGSLVIIGQRRIGKTSLLLQIERTLPKPIGVPIYYDVHYQSSKQLGKLLFDLAEVIAQRLKLSPPGEERFDNEGRFFQRHFLPQAYRSLNRNSRMILLVDEFDAIDQRDAEELPHDSAAKTFIPYLNRLLKGEKELAFIFAVGRRAADLSPEVKGVLESSLALEIRVLDRQSAEKLVRQAERNGTLRFLDEGVERILNLTQCHPYLTQLLCQSVWYQAHKSSKDGTLNDIGPSEAEAAVAEALERGVVALTSIWDGLAPDEKIYASALAQIAEEKEDRSQDEVFAVIRECVPSSRDDELVRAPQNLVKRQILKEDRKGYRRFEIEMFRRWIRQHKPVYEAALELDYVNPEATARFDKGLFYYKRKEWSNADKLFAEAIRINPRHSEAHRLRGETFMRRMQYEKAVHELREAHRLNPTDSRLSLVRALAMYAQEAYSIGDEEKAVKQCGEALELSQGDRDALQIWESIWSKRGDGYLERRKLPEALDCFQKIVDQGGSGYAGKVASISNDLQKEKDTRQLIAKEAVSRVERACRMSAAIAVACREPAGLSSDYENQGVWWGAVRIFREEETELLRLRDGLVALIDERWADSKNEFDAVKTVQPKDKRYGSFAIKQALDYSRRNKGPGVDRSRQYESEAGKVIGHISRLADMMMEAFSALEESKRALIKTNPLLERRLETAVLLLKERREIFKRYIWALKQLQKNELERPRALLGWSAIPREVYMKSSPVKISSGSRVLPAE